jgi:hypothetical protein
MKQVVIIVLYCSLQPQMRPQHRSFRFHYTEFTTTITATFFCNIKFHTYETQTQETHTQTSDTDTNSM